MLERCENGNILLKDLSTKILNECFCRMRRKPGKPYCVMNLCVYERYVRNEM